VAEDNKELTEDHLSKQAINENISFSSLAEQMSMKIGDQGVISPYLSCT